MDRHVAFQLRPSRIIQPKVLPVVLSRSWIIISNCTSALGNNEDVDDNSAFRIVVVVVVVVVVVENVKYTHDK
jgi:hypothetical protein